MTLIELLYFVFVTLGATFAAMWAYHREGWIGGAIAFSFVEAVFVYLFFSGGFYRLISFIFRRSDSKD